MTEQFTRSPERNDQAKPFLRRFYVRLSLVAVSVVALAGCENGPSVSSHPSATPFLEIPSGFTHQWSEPSHPFTGAAVIDVDGDGRDELFVGGGSGQGDALLFFEDGALVNRIAGTGLDDKTGATHGALSTDFDLDGDVDLIVARENGVFVYANDQGRFLSSTVALDLPPDSVPLSVAAADVDKDGDLDLYVSVFVSFPAFRSATFNDPEHAKKNILLINTGDMTFVDKTAETQTASLQNTFHSTFVDLDSDADLDLVLAQNTGEVEIFANEGNGTFRSVPTNSGFGFWMGIAVGDIDQDGDEDLLISNAGNSIPKFLTTGDLREDQRHNINWGLLRNEGGLSFSDQIGTYGLDGYGFAWGAVFEDINQDGLLDLLVAQNYIKWPVHKWFPLDGKALLQFEGEGQEPFVSVESLGLDNPHFGQSPMIADLNGDGRPDVIWLNMDGPLRAFLNQGQSRYLTLRFADDHRCQGAKAEVMLADGTLLRRQVIASTGLLTDQTATLFFGLPGTSPVSKVTITSTSGNVSELDGGLENTTLKVGAAHGC